MTARAYWLDSRHIGVVEEVPSECGPMVWVGEVRTLDDKPVTAWFGAGARVFERPVVGTHPILPVAAGATEAEVLGQLHDRADEIERRR